MTHCGQNPYPNWAGNEILLFFRGRTVEDVYVFSLCKNFDTRYPSINVIR